MSLEAISYSNHGTTSWSLRPLCSTVGQVVTNPTMCFCLWNKQIKKGMSLAVRIPISYMRMPGLKSQFCPQSQVLHSCKGFRYEECVERSATAGTPTDNASLPTVQPTVYAANLLIFCQPGRWQMNFQYAFFYYGWSGAIFHDIGMLARPVPLMKLVGHEANRKNRVDNFFSYFFY